MPRMTNWIASVINYVSRQHLEGAGAAAIIIFGSLYVKNRWQMAASTDVTCHGYQILGVLRGGKMAVQRILDAKLIQGDPSAIKLAEKQLEKVLSDPDEKNMNLEDLQNAVAMLEIGGKEDHALKLLLDAAENAQKQKHKKYEIEMCILELYIYKGEYDNALKQDCLKEIEITDSRQPLYKALIHVIKGNEGEAKRCWKEFLRIQDLLKFDCFHSDQVHDVYMDFVAFKAASLLLKNEIEARKKPKTSSNIGGA